MSNPLRQQNTPFSFLKSNWKLSTRNIHLSSTWNPAPSSFLPHLSQCPSVAAKRRATRPISRAVKVGLAGLHSPVNWRRTWMPKAMVQWVDLNTLFNTPFWRSETIILIMCFYWHIFNTFISKSLNISEKTIKSHANQWHGKMHWNHAFPTPGTGGYKFWRVS